MKNPACLYRAALYCEHCTLDIITALGHITSQHTPHLMKLTFEFGPLSIDGLRSRYASALRDGSTCFSRRQSAQERKEHPNVTAEEWLRGASKAERDEARFHLELAARIDEALSDHDAAIRHETAPAVVRTASDLKWQHEQADPDSKFFTRDSMRFFGDTMANYGLRQPVEIETVMGERVPAFELFRRRPVKVRYQESAWFHAVTFKIVHRKRP